MPQVMGQTKNIYHVMLMKSYDSQHVNFSGIFSENPIWTWKNIHVFFSDHLL
jgi:hypothetical protein